MKKQYFIRLLTDTAVVTNRAVIVNLLEFTAHITIPKLLDYVWFIKTFKNTVKYEQKTI